MSNIINILTIFFSHFFYIVISYIFPENFSEIHQLSLKNLKILMFTEILTIFINLPLLATKKLMMSASIG